MMVIIDGQVLADTNYLKARLHMSLSGAMGSYHGNTHFQIVPENSLRIAATIFCYLDSSHMAGPGNLMVVL